MTNRCSHRFACSLWSPFLDPLQAIHSTFYSTFLTRNLLCSITVCQTRLPGLPQAWCWGGHRLSAASSETQLDAQGPACAAVAPVRDVGEAQGARCAAHAGADRAAGQPGCARRPLCGRPARRSVLSGRLRAHRLPLRAGMERKVRRSCLIVHVAAWPGCMRLCAFPRQQCLPCQGK